MGEHVQGSMDISVQEKTYHGFIKYVRNGAIIVVTLLIFIALVNG